MQIKKRYSLGRHAKMGRSVWVGEEEWSERMKKNATTMKERPCISSFSIGQSEALDGKTAFWQKT